MKRTIQRIFADLFAWLQGQDLAAQYHDLVSRGLLSVGRHTRGIPRIWNYQGSERKVVIGPFSSLAPNVQIITGGIHPTDWVSTYPFRIGWHMEGAGEDGMPTSRGDVVVGADVWLGTGVTVLSGVTIGHGAIVGAQSVVTRDIPPYAIAAGAPATVVRHRFPPDVVEKLLQIAWWEWEDEAIRAAVPLLSSSDMHQFLQRYGNSVKCENKKQ